MQKRIEWSNYWVQIGDLNGIFPQTYPITAQDALCSVRIVFPIKQNTAQQHDVRVIIQAIVPAEGCSISTSTDMVVQKTSLPLPMSCTKPKIRFSPASYVPPLHFSHPSRTSTRFALPTKPLRTRYYHNKATFDSHKFATQNCHTPWCGHLHPEGPLFSLSIERKKINSPLRKPHLMTSLTYSTSS